MKSGIPSGICSVDEDLDAKAQRRKEIQDKMKTDNISVFLCGFASGF
jgi:hypothetical protein